MKLFLFSVVTICFWLKGKIMISYYTYLEQSVVSLVKKIYYDLGLPHEITIYNVIIQLFLQ